ncbi:glycosyltransferase [Chloroflexota bacterium]
MVVKPQKSENTHQNGQAVETNGHIVYSPHLGKQGFAVADLMQYANEIGQQRMERLLAAAESMKGKKVLEINATAQGGGVAEMLYSSVPFMNALGIETDWNIIQGNAEFFEHTKNLHNLLQGQKGVFHPKIKKSYCETLEKCVASNIIGYNPDVVMVNDPQPLGLAHYLKKDNQTWLWRCHIDIEDTIMSANPGLWEFMNSWIGHYNAAVFSAAHYIVSMWPLPSFIIPPFIDPLSEKNRDLSREEIDAVLDKYGVDRSIPTITQVGRFDPWKGLERTIAVFERVSKETKCQLIIAGGLASDDPEGSRILAKIKEKTKNMPWVNILHLSLANREENWREINALQRSADVIMQPSTREGFGLVITEGLWKSKPVVSSNVGAVPLQIRDGETGIFYESPAKTAARVLYLLNNKKVAGELGQRGHDYVQKHFLMPDRIADYLKTIHMVMNSTGGQLAACALPTDCILSFHPWYKMSKRAGRKV